MASTSIRHPNTRRLIRSPSPGTSAIPTTPETGRPGPLSHRSAPGNAYANLSQEIQHPTVHSRAEPHRRKVRSERATEPSDQRADHLIRGKPVTDTVPLDSAHLAARNRKLKAEPRCHQSSKAPVLERAGGFAFSWTGPTGPPAAQVPTGQTSSPSLPHRGRAGPNTEERHS